MWVTFDETVDETSKETSKEDTGLESFGSDIINDKEQLNTLLLLNIRGLLLSKDRTNVQQLQDKMLFTIVLVQPLLNHGYVKIYMMLKCLLKIILFLEAIDAIECKLVYVSISEMILVE